MSQQIKLIRSNVPGKKPDKFNLNVGELALNTADGLFYFKRGDDTVQTLVSTNAVIEGDILISGDFYLTGSAQFSGSVLTIGDSSFSGSINVSSSATFRGPINLYPTEAPTTGEYSASFYVTSSTNDLWIADQSSSFNFTSITDILKSGIIAGGVVSTGSSNTVFNITSGSGQIVDINKDGIYGKPQPTIKYVEWDTFEDQSLTYLSTQPTTWLLIDSDGNLVQQPTTFTDSQYETHIIIGAVIHPNNTNISLTKTFPVVAYGSAQQFEDFTRIFGPIKIEGYGLSASGSSLSVNRASGKAFSLGRNYLNNPESPNIINDNAKTKCLFYRYYRSGSEFITDNNAGAGYSVVDPGYYDDGTGTLAAVPGGQYTVQRIFYFPGQTDLLGIYYGRATYNSLLSAEDGISEEPFSEIENTRSQAILVGYLLVKSGATNLSNTNDAKFVSAGLFRDSGTSGGGGGEGANSLDDLDDVTITSVSSGDLLRYTGAGWENTKGLSGSYSVTGSLLINGTPVTGSFSAGNGLTLSGTTFSLNTGSNHFILGTRKQISVTDTTGASGINLDYNQSTGVLSGSLLNSSIYIGAGNGLTGDGSVSLGSSASLAIGAGTGITVNSNDVQLKNAGSLTGNKVLKWDSGNNQLTNSTITDDGTDVSLTGDLTVGGTLTAQEFYTEFVSSSIIYESGSTKFGDTIDDIHERTGSLNISGSVDTTGNVDANTFSIDGTTVIDSSTNFTGSNAIFSGNLDVAGNTDIDGTLTVLGSTELGNSSTGDTHSITGITSVTGSFAVDNISLDGQQISSLTGDLELNSQGVVDIKTNITASGNNLEFNHTGTGNFTFSSENGNILIESTQFSGDDVIVAGNIAINGGDVTTTDTTANIFNTNATSLNLAGAATSIEIGSNTGTTSINHNLTVDGNTTLGNADADRVDILGETIALSGSNVTLEHDSPNGEFRIQTLGGTNNKLILSSSGDIDIEQSMTMKNIDTSFQSVGYQSGFAGQGFDINFTSQSSAEFDNLTVRGSMRVFELIINQIRATNGSLFVSSVGKVDDVVDLGGDNYALIFDTGSGTVGHGFAENDVIRSQQVDRSAIGEAGVTQSLQGSLVYRSDLTVTSVQDLKVITASLDPGSTPPSSSFDYVRLGNTTNVNRQGNVYLTSDDNYAPFIDVVDGITDHDDWNNSAVSGGVKVRVGKIDGINSPEFGDLTGYGMWASGSVYLEGSINATGGLVGGWAIEPGYLESNNIKLQSSGSAGGELISIGSAASMTGNGVFLSGSGDFNLQADTNEYIRQSNNLLDIKSSEFSLSTGQLTISGSSSDGFISLGTLTDSTTVSNTNNGFFVSSSGEVLIKGGSIADNKFIKVGSSGIDIKSTDFGLKAGTLTVSGSSSTGFIKIGSLTNATTVGTTNSGFYADNSGNVLIKGSSNGSNYLKIDGSGTIDLNSDNFTLTGGSDLKLTNDAGGLLTFGDIVYANAAVAISGSGEFKFEVDADNKIEQSGGTLNIRAENLVAKGNSVEISGSNFHLLNGNITASNVDLSGNITATTGNIGGFAITSDAITGSGFLLSGSATGNEFFISASNFNVKANGNLTASNAQITGDITATSGQIAGFTISGDVIAGVSYSIDASAGAEGEYFISSSDVKIEGNGDAVFGEYRFSKFNDADGLNGLTRTSDSTNIKIIEGRDANGHGALLAINEDGDFYIAPISSSILSGSGWNGFTRELRYDLENDRWEIEQNTYIDGDLEVTGNISGSSFDSSGNVTIGGNLTVVGNTIITGSVTGHPVISPVASDSNNSNGVVVQDLTFDEFGHTNTIGTVDLDNRYLQLSGGTLTGDVSSNSQISSTKSTIGFANLANAAFLAGTTSNGIGIDSNEIRSKGTDLYIGTIDADKIDFGTGGVVSQVVIASGGNLGVGIDTPSSKLHVSGSSDVLLVEGSGSTLFDVQGSQGQLFSVTDNLTGTLFSVNDISGIPILSVDSDDTVTMGTFGANTLVVTGSLVGIGTTSPSALLNVGAAGTLHFTESGIGSMLLKGTSGTARGMFEVHNADGASKALLQAYNGGVSVGTLSETNLDIITSGTARMTISGSNGNVGIGTSSPNSNHKAHIEAGSGNNTSLLVTTTDNADTAQVVIGHDEGLQGGLQLISDKTNSIAKIRVTNSSYFPLAFEVRGSDGINERMRITPTGNVGIGTTSPSHKLDIQSGTGTDDRIGLRLKNNGTGDGDAIIYLDSSAAGESDIDFMHDGSLNWRLRTGDASQATNTNFTINNASNAAVLTLEQGGNIGIGTTSPDSLLHLSGSSNNAIITLENNGNGNVSGIDFVRERSSGPGVNGGSLFLESNTGGTQSFLYLQAQTATADAGITSALTANNGVRLVLKGGQGIFSVETGASEAFKVDNGNATFTGDLTVGGIVTAQEFHTEFVSASIIYQSGSTKFGDTSDDVHSFSGSLRVTGSGNHYFTDGNVGIGTTSPGNTLHVFKNSTTGPITSTTVANAGLRIQDSSYNMYIDGNSIVTDGVGFLTTIGSNDFVIGTNNTARIHVDGGGNVGIGTTSPSTKLEVNGGSKFNELVTVVGDIYPETNYVSNIGAINKKFLTLNVAELIVETLVASERRSTVGGRFNVGISTQLSQSLASGSTTIIVENNNLNNGDIIHLEGGVTPQVEFMKVTSSYTDVAGDGYSYEVERNLDGTGANNWDAGSGVFNTGQIGNGFIDQYAINSLTSGSGVNTAGPTIAFMERTGSLYPDIDIRAGVGNLKGWYGYTTESFGFAAGNYKAQNITVDPTNGLRIRDIDEIQLQAQAGSLTIGDSFLYDSDNGVLFVSGSNIDLVTPSFFLGNSSQFISGSNGNLQIESTNFTVATNGDVSLTGTISAEAGNIGGFAITDSAITGSGFLLSGSATGNEFFISSSKFNVKASGDITGSQVLFTGGKISGSNLEINVENFTALGNSVQISGSNFHLLNGNITASNVDLSGNITATTGNIGGFAITTSAITGSSFYLSGSATGDQFFISASNFNVKANGNLTASNAQISGDITATSGQIAGFTISGDVIAGVSYSIDASAGAEGEYFISSSDVKIEGNGDAVFGEYRFSKFNDEDGLNGLTRTSDSTNIKIIEGRDANGHGALLAINEDGDFYIAPISSSVLSGSGWNGFTRELKYSLANDRWEIEQNTYIDGNLDVTGVISGSSFDSSGNVTIGGNLTVVGDTIITGSVTGHPVISPVASDSNNSNGVVIQDLTFDEFGHTNAIGTVDLDNRYLQLSGGTLTGDVSSNSQISSTKGTIGFANLANAAFLAGTTSNGLGIDSNEIRSNGTDMYIGTISAHDINFGTGGVNSQVVIESGGKVGIGTTTPSAELDVEGSIQIKEANLSYQDNTDVDIGTEVVATVATGSYDAAFFDFVIKKTTNIRAGTVYSVHDGSGNVEFTETSTQDLGDTSDVTLSVDISGGNLRLNATTTSNDWSVKALVRGL